MAIICLLYVGRQQFGPLRHQTLQEDEMFFSACASRSLVDGWATVAGCHDNKGPLIYLLHALLPSAAPPLDGLPLKLVSVLMLALLVVLASVLARRAAPARPALAGLATATLLIVALVPSPSLLAVKTEFLGVLFLLAALAVAPAERASPWPALGTGVALGLALMSKQSYMFLLPVGFWLVWRGSRGLPLRRAAALQLCVAVGIALPMLLLAALFAANGRLYEFLSTTFLYPAIYGGTADPLVHPLKALLWRLTNTSEFLSLTPVHVMLVMVAAFDLRAGPAATPLGRGLLAGSALSLLILLASPTAFKYHTIPFWVLSSILGGALLADALERGRAFASAALLAAAVLGLGMTLRNNGGSPTVDRLAEPLDPATGRYAFVLGLEPRFYARGFIPASSVQFPWALPGTPANWSYRPPAPGSRLHATLQAQQQHNLAVLYADFARTPPAYVVTTDLYARAPGSTRYADVPGFDEYLARNCEYRGPMPDSRDHPGHLFACRPPR